MKKIKILSSSLLFLLIFSLFALTAFATTSPEPEESDTPIVDWTFISKDTLQRTDPDGRVSVYKKAALPHGAYMTRSFYFFKDDPTGNGERYVLYSGNKDAQIVIYDNGYTETEVYATEEGLAMLKSFESALGDSAPYLVYTSSDYTEAEISSELYASFNGLSTEKQEISVNLLEGAEVGRIMALDSYRMITVDVGVIWYLEDSYYYANLTELPNNCFDSEGNLSYRSGNIELKKLDSAATEKFLELAQTADYPNYTYDYEDEAIVNFDPEPLSPLASNLILLGSIALFGVIAPAVPLVISTKKLKKFGKDKAMDIPNLVIFVCSVLWIVFSIIMTLLLFI